MDRKSQLLRLEKERLAQLLENRAAGDKHLAESLHVAVAAKCGSRELVSQIKKQIRKLLKPGKFYDWRSAPEFSLALRDLRANILEDLAGSDLEAAIEVLSGLLERAGEIYEIVDDSNAHVSPVVAEMVRDLGSLFAQRATNDPSLVSEKVLTWILSDEYGVFDYVIPAFAAVLGPIGWMELETLVRTEIRCGQDSGDSTSYRLRRLISVLLEIADLRRDVDGYIDVTEEFGLDYDAHTVDVARRLHDAGRNEQSLTWLAKIKPESHRQCEVLKLRALNFEALGQTAALIEELHGLVVNFRDMSAFEKYLEISSDAEQARHELYREIESRAEPNAALDVFVNLKEIERSAALVWKLRNEWNGSAYYTLAPAAELLEDLQPLEASILYRALIADILKRAQSRYYHHAVRYLRALERLASRIHDWRELAPQDVYLEELREKHKRKSALWARLEEEETDRKILS